MEDLCEIISQRVLERLDYHKDISDEELIFFIDSEISEYKKIRYINISQRQKLKKDIYNSLRGLDILQDLVDDSEITEIMVNGCNDIFVEKNGSLYKLNKRFNSPKKLDEVVRLIVSRNNKAVNINNPIADAMLENGSRVNIMLPPIALNGPIITIRRFPDNPITMQQLIKYDSISREAADLLEKLVQAKYTIFISGGTGAGKSTLLNALSDYIPKDERIITIEDNAELRIMGVKNLVRLEARASTLGADNEVTIRDLLKASLRSRPDRIIIGEIRGAEAIDMLQAVNTGHAGSMSTGHANGTLDMLYRLETMVMMGMDLPLASIRRQIASGLDIMVHLGRLRDRTRRVLEINEIVGLKNDEIELNCLYSFVEQGMENGKIIGHLEKRGDIICKEKLKMSDIRI